MFRGVIESRRKEWVANVGSRGGPALPTFLVIGAAKCGTTSLHRYLDLHPEIGMSRAKEPHYFSGTRRWARGEASYASLFDGSFRVRGESSVGYTVAPHRSGVPERIKTSLPDVALVYAIRDPVARFVSEYVHRVSDGLEHRTLDEAAFAAEGSRAGDRGRYFYQIEQYLEYFEADRLHVLTSERLATRRRETLSSLFAFLDVDSEFWEPRFERVLHESRHFRRKGRVGTLLRRLGNSRAAAIVPADTRRRIGNILYRPFSRPIERPVLGPRALDHLSDYYREDVAALRRFLDDPLDDWSV